MFFVKLIDNRIIVNDYFIFNLLNPFHRKCDLTKSKRSLKRHFVIPNDANLKNIVSYKVPVTDKIVYSLPFRVSNYKSHGLYKTNSKIKKLFRSNALTHIIENLNNEEHPYKIINEYVHKALSFVCKSYDFDYIITDVPTLNINNMPVKYINWHVTSPIIDPTKKGKILNKILNTHKKLSLSHIPSDLLKEIYIEQTDIDLKMIKKQDNILVITGINSQYAGYISTIIKNYIENVQTLPISLFLIK